MTSAELVQQIIQGDALRWHLLGIVRSLALPDCWIGAGFVRNAVWDHLHDRRPDQPSGDVDVIWFDPTRTDATLDRKFEISLGTLEPSVLWSVKNQARMHLRNDDPPYASVTDALKHWPETATAVAVRRDGQDRVEIAAPFGLDDLVGLVIRPTPRFAKDKRHIHEERLHAKCWTARWPLLTVIRQAP